MPKALEALNSAQTLMVLRVVQLVGIPALMGMGGWALTTLHSLDTAVAKLQTQMTERTQDRYTGADARRDQSAITVRFDGLERRVMILEDSRNRQ